MVLVLQNYRLIIAGQQGNSIYKKFIHMLLLVLLSSSFWSLLNIWGSYRVYLLILLALFEVWLLWVLLEVYQICMENGYYGCEITLVYCSIAIMSYPDANLQKAQILRDNKGKAGVYRWENKLNGYSYIGSSTSLKRRLEKYFHAKYLEKNSGNMIINKALVKYGHSNFSFHILEYCDVTNVVSREQYYIDLFKPEYNSLEVASLELGWKHSDLSLEKMKEV